MNLATVLSVTAVLEAAAGFAGWAGGLTYAVCRPASPSRAWRYVVAASVAVGLAVLAYCSALVGLGQGAVFSGRPDQDPTAGGLLVLAAVFGLGAGVPWGTFDHAAALRAGTSGGGEDVWPLARRTSAILFLPFAILGLAIFAPRAEGEAAGTVGGILVGALLVAVFAAVAATAVRHHHAILRQAARGALIGVPVITALMALGGVPLGDAFVFSAASALVWAPVFGFITWVLTGTHEAGFRIRNGMGHPSGWTAGARVEGSSGVRAKESRRARRPPRRKKRR